MPEYGSQAGTMQAERTSTSLLDTLNELRARELAVVTQYMRHHYQVTTPEGLALAGEFKEVAITEMKHAEMLGERIDFLGGDPTTKPAPIGTDARTLEQMAAMDLASEEEAVRLYRDAIKQADSAEDVTTRRMLEGILGDEEDHVNTFRLMLGK
ncbi:MAG TPA: ferritin-like domain-containing protein [Coriobacteriia bacterium]|jgi:bacterioferritin